MAGKPGMKWSKNNGGKGEASPASTPGSAVSGSGAGGNSGASSGPSGSGGNSPGSDGLKPLNPPGPQSKTGNNLEAKPTPGKSVKVEFDIEKLKAAFPKFIRLAFKAANNLFRLVSLLPFVPFKINFEDLTPEEEELFKEAAWPGFEAALPAAAKRHPIAFLMSAVSLLTLGKINFTPKPRPVKTPQPLKEQNKDGKPESQAVSIG
jgi:hypothetical protein